MSFLDYFKSIGFDPIYQTFPIAHLMNRFEPKSELYFRQNQTKIGRNHTLE